MTEVVELNNYFVDTVYPVRNDAETDSSGYHDKLEVQLVRYSVLGKNAEDAVRRFIEEEAGVESERTEPTDFIIVGVFSKDNPIG